MYKLLNFNRVFPAESTPIILCLGNNYVILKRKNGTSLEGK